MPTFELTGPDGGTYQLDAPDEAAALDAFRSFHGGPDKYQQAAIDEAKTNPAIDQQAGYTRRLVHGVTLGADSTLAAAAFAPLEMIRHGTLDPREGYNYAKAREDRIMDLARKNTGWLGTGAELLGGGVAGGGLANAGVTASRWLAPNAGLLGRTAASALDGTALGGFSGAMEGNGLGERASNAATGAMFGGAIGGAAPAALGLLGTAVAPIFSNIRAHVDPAGYAQRQVARAIVESGRPLSDIATDVVNAAREGQPFAVADAMGSAGQRMLSTVARSPGAGRTAVVDALEGRQGTQGRRVSNALAEGFDTPETALQMEARLTTGRDANADAAYGAVRNDAKPVNLTGAIDHIDSTISPGVHRVAGSSNVANDTSEQALQRARNLLTDDSGSTLTDFAAVQRARGDIGDWAQAARQGGQGNKARLLGGVLRQIDTAMENASAGHLAANRAFSQASRDIEAVQSGREAATRGRTEDTIPRYQSLSPQGQAAFRSGYTDPLIANAQGAAFGANKARPLLNDAFAAEADAMAPGNALMQRRLGREQRMFETRNQALGGSRTADDLHDHDAMGIDPTLVGYLLSGNYGSAIKSIIHAGSNVVSGNTPQVRREVATILLQRGAAVTPAALNELVGKTVSQIQFVQNLAQGLGRAGTGAVAVAPNTQRKKNVGGK